MRALVWIDHGNLSVLSGSLSDLKDKVLDVVKYYYSETEVDLIASSKTEAKFEQRVRDITVDDENFETFRFVDVKEI